MILNLSNITDDPAVNNADLRFVDSNIEVMEESDAMAEVCVVLDNIAAGVTLGCEVTATVNIGDGTIASTFRILGKNHDCTSIIIKVRNNPMYPGRICVELEA